MKIIGLLSVPKGLLCKKDVLGKTFYGSVSNIDIAIMFPKLANKTVEDTMNYVGLENQLIAPEIGRNLKRGEDNIFWGYPMSYPITQNIIKKHRLLINSASGVSLLNRDVKLYVHLLLLSLKNFCRSFICFSDIFVMV